ncbi:DNA polymerase II large subunit, partial [Euryarchaeota archaeon ex4484_178]
MVEASREMHRYFEELEAKAEECYRVAEEARRMHFDPVPMVEIPRAKDLAARVEELTGVKGIADEIRKLSIEYDRGMVSLLMAKKVARRFEKKEEALDKAVRVGLAILTEGILVAPLEGIASVKIKRNGDGSEYVSIYYAGPIRGAGGTAQALSVLIADVVRRELDIGKYKPTEEEVERYKEEIQLYDRIHHLQYRPTNDEIELVVKNCPVCIDGEGTENVEVSGYRNLPKIETNRVRGGMCLVLAEGLLQKTKKIKAYVDMLNIDGWEWIDKLIPEVKEDSFKLEPSTKYIKDVLAGRPIFSYPLKPGGFRLRYGRCRAGGLATISVNPATMYILNEFIAIGTQLKMERPGKAGGITSCDSIEGPIVLLDNGDVIQISNMDDAKKYKDKIREIIDVGEILIPYGEFLENNHPLVPSSYVVEWWKQEAERAGFHGEIKDSIHAFKIAEEYGIPLHPDYNLFWHDLSIDELKELSQYVEYHSFWKDDKLYIEKNEQIKEILKKLGALHIEREYYVLDKYAYPLIRCLGLDIKDGHIVRKRNFVNGEIMDAVSHLAGVKVRARAPVRIGTRMGRPEKAAPRKMRPPIHALFPIGNAGGDRRLITEAIKKGVISMEVGIRKCPVCGEKTISPFCPKCGVSTEFTGVVSVRKINLADFFTRAEEHLGLNVNWDVKGVKKMMSSERMPERLEKGILRAKHGVFVFKDGTARFDMTDIAITHFRPREIGLTVEKAKELGYTRDYLGNELISEEQLCELKVQDIIISQKAAEYLVKIANYVDDLLERFYKMKRFYNIHRKEDLIGHLVIGLAPHTSAGILGRIIGFTDANVGFAHPFFHAAKRRNCDGDEDSIMLLLEGLLDFSRKFLPSTRGGLMDAPLVLTTRITPTEIDKEALHVDVMERYPLEFYEKTLEFAKPDDVASIMDFVKKRIGTPRQYEGFKFTHDTRDINQGVLTSAYKLLGSMYDKLESQLSLAKKIRAVDEHDMAARIIT